MAWDPNIVLRLRGLLGETIPIGGSETDTFFSDAEITSMLDETSGDSRRAAYTGWQLKAANYADLITITEGNATRQMSDLHAHALAMVKQFAGSGTALTAGRTRVGRIVRRF